MTIFMSAAVLSRLDGGARLFLRGVLEGLAGADLDDVVAQFVDRVVPPGAYSYRVVDEQGTFRPYVELLLRELQRVASAPGWSRQMRSHAARAAITDAGF